MNHKVLYRKYRPNDFDSIIGQDIIIKTLKNAIKSDKIAHAYIFSGPRGTGKTTTAKVFAKALNCLNYDDGPCNKCDSCINISNNPDIIEIDAASNNGVDDVRELINNVRLAPSTSKYKIYIIDEVHMLTQNAFNALLLTLEEPPTNVVFILATTNVESVPITILSRCQRFDFSQISMDSLKERLKFVINSEKLDVDDDAINEICLLSEGGMRDALSILDQLSSQNSKITLDIVQKSFNIINSKIISELVKSFYDNNKTQLIEILNDIDKNSYDFKNLVKKIIEKFYEDIINNEANIETIKSIILELNKLLNDINIYVNPYTLLKVVFVSYMIPEKINRQEVKEQNETNVNVSTEKVSDKDTNYFPGNNFDDKLDKMIKIRINNTFVNPTKENLLENQKLWGKLKEKTEDANLLSLLIDSKISASSDNYAIVTAELEATTHLINSSLEKIEDMFNKICKKNVKFVCITNERWNKLKQEYVKNTKNNIKYTFVEEEIIGYNNEEMKNIAEDVFQNINIEME